MRNSFLIYHVVIYSPSRMPFLREDICQSLFDSVGDFIRNSGNSIVEIGGCSEHLHVLLETNSFTPIHDLLENIRLQAVRWLHHQIVFSDEEDLDLDIGFFTVSYSMLDKVRRFIVDQPRHHETASFEDEYLELLDKHCVTYEEESLWSVHQP